MKLRLAAILVLALAGCASKPVERAPDRISERVILLPSETGKPSGVVVRHGDVEIVLSAPYAAVEVRGGTMEPAAITAEEVERRYGGLLSA